MNKQDYLQEAREFYASTGVKYIEVPWIVSREAIDATIPDPTIKPHEVILDGENKGCLVGSAETSFVQMLLDNKLEPFVEYQAITPCFRGDQIDLLHSNYFMKLELFMYTEDRTYTSSHFLERAAELFTNLGIKTRWLSTPVGHDLVDSKYGIELGSYGRRGYKGMSWVMGTGIAQPRTSQVLDRLALND